MADLEGTTALVTGANTGIGKETARALAARGAQVVLAGRSRERVTAAREEIARETGNHDLDVLVVDLGDLDSVRSASAEFLGGHGRLDVLVNNAGQGGLRGLTVSGFEMAFGINHVGTAALTEALLGAVKAGAPARIVVVASVAHKGVPGFDWEALRRPTKSRTGFPEYAVSKLANVLYARELGHRLQGTGVTTYAVHPGAIASDIWRQIPRPFRSLGTRFMKSPVEGARTSLYCATSLDVAGQTGLYYADERVAATGRSVTDELAAQLWERTQAWIRE